MIALGCCPRAVALACRYTLSTLGCLGAGCLPANRGTPHWLSGGKRPSSGHTPKMQISVEEFLLKNYTFFFEGEDHNAVPKYVLLFSAVWLVSAAPARCGCPCCTRHGKALRCPLTGWAVHGSNGRRGMVLVRPLQPSAARSLPATVPLLIARSLSTVPLLIARSLFASTLLLARCSALRISARCASQWGR